MFTVPASSIVSRRTDNTMKLKLPQKSGYVTLSFTSLLLHGYLKCYFDLLLHTNISNNISNLNKYLKEYKFQINTFCYFHGRETKYLAIRF